MTTKTKAFWAGFLAHASFMSLHQDFYGKETWLQMAAIGWVTAWVTVPLALLLLITAGCLLSEKK
jgi:hypothetical protein